ncbi:MAG: HAMP domain-containing sensor histidine kinase [Oscillospiraceae bacterium]|nr:HAMP domain-containing sensor histidine kinase [Oscillospiraceae bacterium]
MKQKNTSGHGGLARRWSLRTAALIGVFLLVLITSITLMVRHFAYDGVRQQLYGRGRAITQIYHGDGESWYQMAPVLVQSADGDKDVAMAAVDENGTVLSASDSSVASASLGDDFQKALESKDGWASWTGTFPDGDYGMAVTLLLKNESGQVYGGVRYFTSLGSASATVLWACLGMIGGGLLLMGAILLVSRRFVRQLTGPLKEINLTASRIAQGDFNIRLEKKKDDEIGELCDAINDMAVSLDTMENMKNEFISSVSHELRTPLTAIKGWAETMQCGTMDDETFDRGMSIIIRESERLSGIVEELLDFSRMQSGKMKTNMEKTDLLEELGETVYLFSDRAKAEHKFLLYEPPKALPPVYGDGNRLRQVFVNIIDNALKYTDEGGTVNVSARSDGDFIYIVVADNGCGIPAEHLPNVKRKFYKANQTIRGSGIGLALADEIIALHAGVLQIDSREHLGTVVTITIPTYDNFQRQRAKIHG